MGTKPPVREYTVEAAVHNLAVDDLHTYFVLTGDDAVLVHNCSGVGQYGDVGGHHIHAKAAFRGDANYSPSSAISISQEAMSNAGIAHEAITATQRRLFNQLAEAGSPNTLRAHTRIAVEALIAGGADRSLARSLAAQSIWNLRQQGVRWPSRIPWN